MSADHCEQRSPRPGRRGFPVFGVLALACVIMAGCASPGSYTRIPGRFTALPAAPNSEAYLIELIHASAEPTATRYEFTFQGRDVTVQIAKIAASGARSERRRSGDIAPRLLQLFRAFDWGSIEAPLPDEDGAAPLADETEFVIKARTQRSYREAQVRLAKCAAARELLAAIESVK